MNPTRLIILGAGESGVSAALLARREGYGVFVSDHGPGHPTYLAELDAAGIAYEINGHDTERILAADLVVKSPGIPDTAPPVVALHGRGVPVISEIEFAYRHRPAGAKIVGITGSNGKTTTTLLVQHLLELGGIAARAGGNLGDSFARLLLEEAPAEVYVLELSSFQLDGITTFRPDVAAVLNITPDHLDRYDYRLEAYADSKLRIAMNQGPEDWLYVLADPKTIAPALRRRKTAARVVEIDPARVDKAGSIPWKGFEFGLTDGQLRGRHNALNAWFAVTIAARLGVPAPTLQLGLNSFQPAPHRMEVVPTADGRRWINDSKATNVDATYFALDALDGPTVWIAGGTDKGNDYDVLHPAVQRWVHTLVCLGVDNEKLRSAFVADVDRVYECGSAAEAVRRAAEAARPGDRILLSPACASFDLFKNYIDRGDQFRDAVKALAV